MTSLILAGQIQFGVLADCIKRHENSVKFPYGCEHRVAGKLQGWPEPEARGICIRICQRTFDKWKAGGMRGDYFTALNKVYAADLKWYCDVETKYVKSISAKHRKID